MNLRVPNQVGKQAGKQVRLQAGLTSQGPGWGGTLGGKVPAARMPSQSPVTERRRDKHRDSLHGLAAWELYCGWFFLFGIIFFEGANGQILMPGVAFSSSIICSRIIFFQFLTLLFISLYQSWEIQYFFFMVTERVGLGICCKLICVYRKRETVHRKNKRERNNWMLSWTGRQFTELMTCTL